MTFVNLIYKEKDFQNLAEIFLRTNTVNEFVEEAIHTKVSHFDGSHKIDFNTAITVWQSFKALENVMSSVNWVGDEV
jgi:hypothetical protein